MSDVCHKYLCVFCKCFIFGTDVIRLASNINTHNSDKHPMESSNWTGAGIVFSTHYTGPASPNANWKPQGDVEIEPLRKPREEYTKPHGTNENRFMTPAGYKVLATLGVKW